MIRPQPDQYDPASAQRQAVINSIPPSDVHLCPNCGRMVEFDCTEAGIERFTDCATFSKPEPPIQ